MFAQIAPQYDRLNHLLSLNIDKSWRNKTVQAMRSAAKHSLLDVCTGTGDLAAAFATQTNCEKIVATDFCAPMLEIARKKQVRDSIAASRLSYLEADAQELPFDDNSFEAVTVAFGIRNVADTLLGLKEMLRVCKPGGRIGVLEFSKPSWPVLKQFYSGYFRYVLPKIGQTFARNESSAYEYLPQSVSEFPCGEAFMELMRQAGYDSVTQQPMTFGVVTLYLGNKPL